MKLPSVPEASSGSSTGTDWAKSVVLEKLPVLCEFLCCPVWEGDIQRGERSLMMFVKVASVAAILKVEHPALKLVVSGSSFDEALAALEAALRLPNPPFQVDDNPLGKGSRKRK